jgi:hypothetical protein
MRWACERVVAFVAAGAATMLHGRGARCDPGAEPSYGRIEGDITLVFGAGGVIAPRGPRAEAELRLRYLESSGLFAAYEDGPLLGASSEPLRVLAVGLEVRPLFLFRWLEGLETRRARFDLALDSIGLELGAVFSQPSGAAFGSRPGAQVGLGVELPIAANATGAWIGLHGGLRWSDIALASGIVESPDDRGAYLAITLSWHHVVKVHVVDVGDRAPD